MLNYLRFFPKTQEKEGDVAKLISILQHPRPSINRGNFQFFYDQNKTITTTFISINPNAILSSDGKSGIEEKLNFTVFLGCLFLLFLCGIDNPD